MKVVALCLVFAASPTLGQHVTGKTFVNDPEHIERLNSITGSTWKAGANPFFDGFTFEDARVFLGTDLSHISEHLHQVLNESVYSSIRADSIPASFDATTHWAGLTHPIRDQQQCGSCWAFSASEVLSDRVAIAQGSASAVLSPQDMVSCDTGDNGCSGGSLPGAWSYLETDGIVSEACLPYTSGDGNAPQCRHHCSDSEDWSRSKIKARTSYAINGEMNMRKEIFTNGPIQVGFKVYSSFMSYKSGVYQKHWYEFLPEGGHAVKVVGFGVDKGNAYWKIANSWGPVWGEEGYFRILRGKDECGLETMGPPYAGLPALSNQLVV